VVELAQRLGESGGDQDVLMDQYQDYQMASMEDLPTLEPGGRMDKFWFKMEKEVVCTTGQPRFQAISRLALVALSLPHSNADAERSFSMLKKIQTDTRENLSARTVHALMTTKINVDSPCHDFVPPSTMLKLVRKACSEYKAQTGTPEL
jgi:hypothetical protein